MRTQTADLPIRISCSCGLSPSKEGDFRRSPTGANLAWIRTSGVGNPLAGKRGRFGAWRLAGGALGAFGTPRNLGLAEGLEPGTSVSRTFGLYAAARAHSCG